MGPKLKNQGNFESRTSREGPPYSKQTGPNSEVLIPPATKKTLRGGVADLEIHYSTMQNILWEVSHMVPYKKRQYITSSTKLCSTSCLFSTMYGQHVFEYWFFNVRSFSWWIWYSLLCTWKRSENSYLGHKRPKSISTIWITQEKIEVWHAGHANSVVCPYYLNFETVRRVGYYQILDNYIRSEPQICSQDAVFKQGGGPFITRAVRALSDEMLLNSRLERYGPTGWPEK